jgi:hypothetical protein
MLVQQESESDSKVERSRIVNVSTPRGVSTHPGKATPCGSEVADNGR